MGVDFSLTLLHPSPSAQWPDSTLGLECMKCTHAHAHKHTGAHLDIQCMRSLMCIRSILYKK